MDNVLRYVSRGCINKNELECDVCVLSREKRLISKVRVEIFLKDVVIFICFNLFVMVWNGCGTMFQT